MADRLRVFLTQEEDQTLFELRIATTLPQRIKDIPHLSNRVKNLLPRCLKRSQILV